MIEELKQDLTGVVCLHCGMHTPLPEPTSRGLSTSVFKKTNPHVSIIRCIGCGKEAPYLADEIVALKEISSFARYAA